MQKGRIFKQGHSYPTRTSRSNENIKPTRILYNDSNNNSIDREGVKQQKEISRMENAKRNDNKKNKFEKINSVDIGEILQICYKEYDRKNEIFAGIMDDIALNARINYVIDVMQL